MTEGDGTPRASVVLAVCGSVAAYKAVEVCRRLVDAGLHVIPVMTAGAARFLGPATLSALASEPVHTSLWDDDDPVPHISIARRSDLVVVAPATARVLGAYAAGIASDLLTNLLLATRAPVLVFPAMHTEMWEHAATRANVSLLRERGVTVVEPDHGRLAGGDEGAGRLPDPARIAQQVLAAVAALPGAAAPPDLAGYRVVVTAGGTREPIDAVRFLGNRSSGRQGEALAAEAAARGAEVVLVTAAPPPPARAGIEVVPVGTAAEMEAEVMARAPSAHAVVMAAAVADFRPKAPAEGKIRKDEGLPDLVLEPTTDILAALGRSRRPGQVLVGFAAEAGDPRPGAVAKLRAKRLDAVVGNDVTAAGAGFGHDTNAVVIVEDDGSGGVVGHELELTSKRRVAAAVLDVVARRLRARPAGT